MRRPLEPAVAYVNVRLLGAAEVEGEGVPPSAGLLRLRLDLSAPPPPG